MTEAKLLETELLESHPELDKIFAKIKKTPKNALNKGNLLIGDSKDRVYRDKCENFCHSFYFGAGAYQQDLERLAKKLNDLNAQKADVESKLEASFKLMDNLPAQFNEALELVHKKIQNWFEEDSKNKIADYKKYQANPLYHMLRLRESKYECEYFFRKVQKLGGRFVFDQVKSDDELINYMVNLGFENNHPQFVKYVNDISRNQVEKYERKIATELARDLKKEADDYFEYVKANFIDEIAGYCIDGLIIPTQLTPFHLN